MGKASREKKKFAEPGLTAEIMNLEAPSAFAKTSLPLRVYTNIGLAYEKKGLIDEAIKNIRQP